jgi:hypothetical protein
VCKLVRTELQIEQPKNLGSILGRNKTVFHFPECSNGSGVHPNSYPMGSVGSFAADEAAGP